VCPVRASASATAAVSGYAPGSSGASTTYVSRNSSHNSFGVASRPLVSVAS